MTDPSPETDADSDTSQTPGESGEHEPSDGAWKDIPLSDYRDLFASMVHFSMKTANSNAEAGGIRLTSASALKGRYLCVRTQLGAGQPVALDYQKNAGIAATLAKQLRAAQAGLAPPGQGAALCAAYDSVLERPFQSGLDPVSPRLRQVLLPQPRADSGYVAVTPLSSAGTAVRLSGWVGAHNKALKDGSKPRALHRRIRTANLGFGGSNPQNVGSLVRNLQTLVVVEAPTESSSLRAALALHYKGPQVRLPERAVADYAQWRTQVIRNHDGMSTPLEHREHEKTLIQALARQIQAALHEQYRLLERHAQGLPASLTPEGEPTLFAAGVPTWLKSLVEPVWRESDWARVAGRHLAGALLHHRNPKGQTLGLGDETQEDLGRLIEEVLT